jgi:DNA-binding NtrC family response regulator
MAEQGIIIADRESEARREVAEIFTNAGYKVETTDSAVHVLCNILEKQSPVVLLGNDFDNKISSADLIQLLKKCNRRLTIILVSDEESLPIVRKIRKQGIFYHALTPRSQEDREEICQAVKCAMQQSLKEA